VCLLKHLSQLLYLFVLLLNFLGVFAFETNLCMLQHVNKRSNFILHGFVGFFELIIVLLQLLTDRCQFIVGILCFLILCHRDPEPVLVEDRFLEQLSDLLFVGGVGVVHMHGHHSFEVNLLHNRPNLIVIQRWNLSLDELLESRPCFVPFVVFLFFGAHVSHYPFNLVFGFAHQRILIVL